MGSKPSRGDLERAHGETREAWDANAPFWDQRMGEGNDFVNDLIWPATRLLLDPRPGERLLDVGCGNGLYARKLADLGTDVIAFDFAPEMVRLAQARTTPEQLARIDYQVLDATNESLLLGLGENSFDGAICQMALMDMSDIEPLMRALARLLRPQGRFVFSVMHPCFNSAHTKHVGELEDQGGQVIITYSIKVSRYMTPTLARGAAIPGQSHPQVYFHRPLETLLGAAFAQGLVLDGLQERAFAPDHPPGSTALSWGGSFSEIPPVLVARLRPS